jgi:hypothetical protein
VHVNGYDADGIDEPIQQHRDTDKFVERHCMNLEVSRGRPLRPTSLSSRLGVHAEERDAVLARNRVFGKQVFGKQVFGKQISRKKSLATGARKRPRRQDLKVFLAPLSGAIA